MRYLLEPYLPCSRHELIDRCLAEERLSSDEAAQFRAFCELLSAYYHFYFHQMLEVLKINFAPFNPDAGAPLGAAKDGMHDRQMLDACEGRFVATLARVLARGNFRPLDQAEMHAAISRSSLIDLRTQVNLDDFDRLLFYARGKMTMPVTLRKFWRQRTVITPIYEQVVLGIKFKDAGYFLRQHRNPRTLEFTPGHLYLYLYKNIPAYDLELLFPNVHLHMNWLDQVLFVVPALGAGVSVLVKALPNLLLIAGVILFYTLGPEFAARAGVGRDQITNMMPMLAALLSVVVALGGFAFKQYSGYQNRRLQFVKNVTETLFFKNLATNASVLHALVDAAEEEETKEIILVYYHLLVNDGPLSLPQLNDCVERWVSRTFHLQVDLDIANTLRDMQTLPTLTHTEATSPESRPEGTREGAPALVAMDGTGCYRALPLSQAKAALDCAWDQAFPYHTPARTAQDAQRA
jgi:hypothetical protein